VSSQNWFVRPTRLLGLAILLTAVGLTMGVAIKLKALAKFTEAIRPNARLVNAHQKGARLWNPQGQLEQTLGDCGEALLDATFARLKPNHVPIFAQQQAAPVQPPIWLPPPRIDPKTLYESRDNQVQKQFHGPSETFIWTTLSIAGAAFFIAVIAGFCQVKSEQR
jgi:hypothetical protein